MHRNDFPLGYMPDGKSLPTCQICHKRVYHTWQAGWVLRVPGTVCECEQPRLRVFDKERFLQPTLF